MESYIKEAASQIQNFCETIKKNEDAKENRNNKKTVNGEQKMLIRNIRLKLDAMERKL